MNAKNEEVAEEKWRKIRGCFFKKGNLKIFVDTTL